MQQIGLSINDAFAADLFADIESDTSDSALIPLWLTSIPLLVV